MCKYVLCTIDVYVCLKHISWFLGVGMGYLQLHVCCICLPRINVYVCVHNVDVSCICMGVCRWVCLCMYSAYVHAYVSCICMGGYS